MSPFLFIAASLLWLLHIKLAVYHFASVYAHSLLLGEHTKPAGPISRILHPLGTWKYGWKCPDYVHCYCFCRTQQPAGWTITNHFTDICYRGEMRQCRFNTNTNVRCKQERQPKIPCNGVIFSCQPLIFQRLKQKNPWCLTKIVKCTPISFFQSLWDNHTGWLGVKH